MKIRTDLAMEAESFTTATGRLQGIKVTEKKDDDITITRMDVLNHIGEEMIGKAMGTYITIDAPMLPDFDDVYHEKISVIIAKEIKELIIGAYHWHSKAPEILIAGLGNDAATPDALGPMTVSNLCITRHRINENKDDAFAVVSAISPGVLAETGIESSDIINAVIKKTEPDILIVIDALAARNLKRLNKTVQISNTGIDPGSGVGNHRKAINKKTMGIPVIAIGVPTVVDAATMIYDALDDEMSEEMYKKYCRMYVTSKDVDAIVNRVSYTISEALNKCMGNII